MLLHSHLHLVSGLELDHSTKEKERRLQGKGMLWFSRSNDVLANAASLGKNGLSCRRKGCGKEGEHGEYEWGGGLGGKKGRLLGLDREAGSNTSYNKPRIRTSIPVHYADLGGLNYMLPSCSLRYSV